MRSLTIEQEVTRLSDEAFALRYDTVVRVEGHYDIAFWQFTLQRIMPSRRFKIFHESNYPTENTSGKASVLQFKQFAARDFILCVDSDYDYLLEREDLMLPYIFQTYVYSVENYQSYAPSLLSILKKHLDMETANFDFTELLERYSLIVHRLLVYSLFSMYTDGEFNAHRCGNEIGFQMIKDTELSLQILAQNIENQCLIWASQYDNLQEFSDFKSRVSELGLTEKNAYLFLRGHDVLEKVVLKFLESIAKPFKNDEFKRKIKEGGNESAAQYQSYLNQNNLEFLLKNNTNYTNCSFYQKIESDLKRDFNIS